MGKPLPDIVLLADRIAPADLAELAERFFGDMVKVVVDDTPRPEAHRAALRALLQQTAESAAQVPLLDC